MADNVRMRESMTVRPAADTPRVSLWLSNLDMVISNRHTPLLHFYKPNSIAGAGKDNDFFDMHLLKDALSKALVPFYPLAGRLRQTKDENGVNGRIEIDCNAEGVLFAVADSSSCMNDFGDFVPTPGFGGGLIPTVDYSGGISSFPLLLIQITYFRCGGVALGLCIDHHVADGQSTFNFIKTWSDMARGLDVAVQPSMNRTILRARDPPRPLPDHNHHIEYPPPNKNESTTAAKTSSFRFTREQLNVLKAISTMIKADGDVKNTSPVKFSTFEVFAGHVWRCACKARELGNEQETTLYLVVNGRPRFRPRLPTGYFGSVVFRATATALAGDLISKPIWYAAACIHNALLRMDDEYLRSTIDYFELEQRHRELSSLAHGTHFRCPNLAINSWFALSIYDSDFGWGKPIFVGRSEIQVEGRAYMLPSATDDGSLSLSIRLQSEHMKSFSKLVYDLGSIFTSCM